MKLEIMPFATERAGDLLGFLKQSWLDTYIGEVGRSATNGLIQSVLGDGLDALLPGNDEEACLGVIGSQIVGSIICAYRNGYLYIWGLYVGRQHQRKGIGRALLCHVMADRHEDVIVEVSVLRASERARRFYDKLGFRQVAEESYEMGSGNPVPSLILQAPVSTIRRHCCP
nr:GNAT family N-acetyltransferase [uncultured Cohaesibacter sp.]